MNVFTQRSDRVKGVDLHPTEPWILACLYSGNVVIWNYVEGSMVKSFEITDLPVRTAKFVPRKQWVICGADDMHVRVYNYNTMDKVKSWEAHTDYIRHIAVHPTLPLILTASDDMLVKLWDWDKGWACTQVFEGHSHYVMHVAFNPKDPNTFASASLDRTVKVWSIGSHMPNFTLEGHEKGVNCVGYYQGGDRPYLASGADDRLVKVWDYQTKACIQTLDGHAHNVTAVAFHPELPLLITGSEDGTVKLWHSTTYRLEQTLDHGLERVWGLAVAHGSPALVAGYDEGCVMVRLGRDEPVASMDAGGKLVWARNNEVQAANLRALGGDGGAGGSIAAASDGERLPLAVKDLGPSELYPQSLEHSSNGRFVALCGDGEYVIYTALAWRNKAFGPALDFAWGEDSSTYAVRESPGSVKIFRGFKEALTIPLGGVAEGIHGGALLGVRSSDAVTFYDWTTGAVVRRVEASVKWVRWSEGGCYVALAGDASTHVLAYDRGAAEAALATGEGVDEDGVEAAFDLAWEVPERLASAVWVGAECLAYTTPSLRLCYAVGGETSVLAHLDRPLYLLGYLASAGKLFLLDRGGAVVGYALQLGAIEFKTRVLRGDVDEALEMLEETVDDGAGGVAPLIPTTEHASLAKFLEAQGHLEAAAAVTPDTEHKFDLALALGRLDDATALARESGNELAWRALGDAALAAGEFGVASHALSAARDRPGQLLLALAARDDAALERLATDAAEQGARNVAFAAAWARGDVDGALDQLLAAGRLPEAALLARSCRPSRAGAVVARWREDLTRTNAKAAAALADPDEYPNLFPGWDQALEAESILYGGGVKASAGAAESAGIAGPEAREEAGSPAGVLPAAPFVDEEEEEEEDVGVTTAFAAAAPAAVPETHWHEPTAEPEAFAADEPAAAYEDEEFASEEAAPSAAAEEEEPPAFATGELTAPVAATLFGGAADDDYEEEEEPAAVEPLSVSVEGAWEPSLAPAAAAVSSVPAVPAPSPVPTTTAPAPKEVDDLAAAFGGLTADEEALLAEEDGDVDDDELAGFGDAEGDLDLGDGSFDDDWGLDEPADAKRD